MLLKLLSLHVESWQSYISTAAVLFLIVFALYQLLYKKQSFINKKVSWWLIGVLIVLRAINAGLQSFLQYSMWKNDTAGIGKYFLPPHQSLGYFLHYAWIHFVASSTLTIVFSILFYLVLAGIRRYRNEIFEEGELELAAAGALIISWPISVIYILLIAIALVIFSVARKILLKEQYTTITWPIVISLVLCLLWGAKLIMALNISALKM